MIVAKSWPFCTSAIFCVAVVEPLKNASQLVVIAAVAALPAVGSVDDGAPDDGAADDGAPDDGAEEDGDEEPVAVLLLELLQELTPIAAASAKPNARYRITPPSGAGLSNQQVLLIVPRMLP